MDRDLIAEEGLVIDFPLNNYSNLWKIEKCMKKVIVDYFGNDFLLFKIWIPLYPLCIRYVIGSPYFFHQEKYKKDNLKIISYFQFLNETRNKSLIIKNNNYNKALGRIKLLKQEYGIIPLDSFYLEDNLEEIPNQKIISISNEDFKDGTFIKKIEDTLLTFLSNLFKLNIIPECMYICANKSSIENLKNQLYLYMGCDEEDIEKDIQNEIYFMGVQIKLRENKYSEEDNVYNCFIYNK